MEGHAGGQEFLSELFGKKLDSDIDSETLPAPNYDAGLAIFDAPASFELGEQFLHVNPNTQLPLSEASSLVVGRGMPHSTTETTGVGPDSYLIPDSIRAPLSVTMAGQVQTSPNAVSTSMSSQKDSSARRQTQKHCYLLKPGATKSPIKMNMASSRKDPISSVHKEIVFASDADGNVVQNQLHDAFPSLPKCNYRIARGDGSGQLHFMPSDEPSFKEIKSFIKGNGAVYIVPKVQEQYPNSESKVESGVFMGSMEPPVDSLPLSDLNHIKKMAPGTACNLTCKVVRSGIFPFDQLCRLTVNTQAHPADVGSLLPAPF